MIGLIQRVKRAQVMVEDETIGHINTGILLLLGVEKNDTSSSTKKLSKKVANLRIFPDEEGKMNRSLLDIKGELLVISQFTLVADTAKGNRPGFSNSAPPALGKSLYCEFIEHFSCTYSTCKSGRFGANMQVELINDGPATFYLNV
ncbi:MAG: D-tyrosyl-tRNA(Tyr) deacylase [Alphaproteobacteria bacterium]|jgi:D-tyrosyl-tRNA(Tyr) deacylase